VGFFERPVDVVAEIRRTEQCLLAILPILDRNTLGWRQAALVDMALAAQLFDRRADAVSLSPLDQRAFGEKDVMPYVECGEVIADRVHHHRNRARSHGRQPRALGLLFEATAELGGQCCSNRLEVIARIESFWNCADRLAQGLAVTQKRGPRERIDLC